MGQEGINDHLHQIGVGAGLHRSSDGVQDVLHGAGVVLGVVVRDVGNDGVEIQAERYIQVPVPVLREYSLITSDATVAEI